MKTIQQEFDRGNFTQAEEMITKLEIKTLNETEQWQIHTIKEMIYRIRIDFSKTLEDILPYIKTYYPDVTEDQILEWEKNKSLEMKIIDGEKRYFNNAQYNLFRVDADAKRKKIKVDGVTDDALDKFLSTHIPDIVLEGRKTGKTLLHPVSMTLDYTLSVDPNAVPEGETIRCWLPYPRTDHSRQTLVSLISMNTENYQIAPDECSQRTVYAEKIAVKDEATVFNMVFSYTSQAEWHPLTENQIKPYNRVSELYQRYTREEKDHILFTDEIKKVSAALVSPEDNPLIKAKKIYQWINDNFPWTSAREYSTITNIPSYVLENKKGDCGQVTLLFLTLARYNGIPAKWQSGWMLHPGNVNLHDWGEIYFEGVGWIPVDMSFGLRPSDDPNVHWFYLGGIDSYRLIVNDDFGQPLCPAKKWLRSETVDFQRGEVEWNGGNLYFDQWDYSMKVKYN